VRPVGAPQDAIRIVFDKGAHGLCESIPWRAAAIEAVWTAEPLGERLLTFQVEDDCDIVTTSVYVTVYEE
jgi:hypothetical protein